MPLIRAHPALQNKNIGGDLGVLELHQDEALGYHDLLHIGKQLRPILTLLPGEPGPRLHARERREEGGGGQGCVLLIRKKAVADIGEKCVEKILMGNLKRCIDENKAKNRAPAPIFHDTPLKEDDRSSEVRPSSDQGAMTETTTAGSSGQIRAKRQPRVAL
ncbi:unnamed protein product [Arctogadus glacialis]